MSRTRAFSAGAVAAAVAAALSGCSEAPASTPAAPPPSAPVAEVLVQAVEQSAVFTGRVDAVERVEVRPRVAGTIERVLFREGEKVRAGQPLFVIDPRPFDVAVQRAAAELANREARLSLATAEAERAERLAAENAISSEERDRRRAALKESVARMEAARAALAGARLDREFSDIRAPIAGRIGRANVTAGNLVAAGTAQPPLATLVSEEALYVYLEVNDGPLAAEIGLGRSQGKELLRHWKARVLGADGALLAEAPIDFADNEVAAGTGTLRLRARVTHGAGLLPGMFARVQLVTGERRDAVLVDDRAIGADQGQRYVIVARADNQLEYRAVRLGALSGTLRVVESGLAAGESIVVNGLMKVRPGMTVQPKRVAMPGVSSPIQSSRTGAGAQRLSGQPG